MSANTATGTSVWSIDASHSLAEFSVKHMMISTVKGSFPDVSGQITIDENDFANSSVEVNINVESITTRDEGRDTHLKSPDFFNAAEYPVLKFVSTRIVPGKGDEFTLIGNLTIQNITREVEIKAEKTGSGVTPWGSTVAGFEGDTKINRKDFGLNWNVALETGGILVGDDVKIHLEVEAIRQ
ncbi:MAG: polyisoprenoid-binding protein [Thermomicrobiales bacterium]|nr:polyisoprenoid-binding protein [Thermomicrobiales bacterium]